MFVKPDIHSDIGKKEQVAAMFDSISKKYDFLNRFLSLGIDKIWRKKAIQILTSHQPKLILDVATGTADFAIEALKVNPEKIIGIDISQGMLDIGKQKLKEKGIQNIELQKGDSEHIQFNDNSFDAVTVSFGVRNFENLELGLSEILRVLKPNAVLLILEFSSPRKGLFKHIFAFYSKYILPFWGKMISKNDQAYTYLPESVKHFPDGEQFISKLTQLGYKNPKEQRLTFGVCTIYTAIKSTI